MTGVQTCALPISDQAIASGLARLLLAARSLNENFLTEIQGLTISTSLEFPKECGLGSSSTLIANVANWAGSDPYELHWKISQGSAYDIACAEASGPLLYRLEGKQPRVSQVNFNPAFSDSLFFAYLGHKQDSASGIETFRRKVKLSDKGLLAEISRLTGAVLASRDLSEFSSLLKAHEEILGKVLGLLPLGKTLFRDFPGTVKSLGAWGGDFVLLASQIGREAVKSELDKLGIDVFFGFDEMVLK